MVTESYLIEVVWKQFIFFIFRYQLRLLYLYLYVDLVCSS